MVQPVRTFLIFTDGEIWQTRLLKKGFGHIKILVCDGYNWVMFNPCETHLEWEILTMMPGEDAIKAVRNGGTVVKINRNHEPSSKWICNIRVMSCVLMVKYYLGIKCRALTPYQLYKYLLKYNLGEIHGR